MPSLITSMVALKPAAGQGLTLNARLQPPYIEFPDPKQSEELKQIDAKLAKLDAKSQAQEIGQLKQQRAQVQESIPAAMVMKERAEIRPTYILVRGAYDNPGEPVVRDTPTFLPPTDKKDGVKNRMDLAKWLVAPSNPLTASRCGQSLLATALRRWDRQDLGGFWCSGRLAEPSAAAGSFDTAIYRIRLGCKSPRSSYRGLGNLPAILCRLARSVCL